MEFLAHSHQKVIHFPIALLMLYPIMEFLAFAAYKEFYIKSAGLFLLVGTLGALASALTGNQAFTFFNDWQSETLDIFNSHQTYANITVWYFSVLLVFRTYFLIKKKLSKKFLMIFFFLSLAGIYFIYQTANFGGKLATERIKYLNFKVEIKN